MSENVSLKSITQEAIYLQHHAPKTAIRSKTRLAANAIKRIRGVCTLESANWPKAYYFWSIKKPAF
jgi:hypothetical protein